MINLAAVATATLLTLSGATEIPKDFLLFEKAARQVDNEESWSKISDSLSKQLLIKPCKGKRSTADGREAMRTVVIDTSAPSFSAEQLVIYRSPGTAQKAFKRLRAEILRCHQNRYTIKPSRVGDQAFAVTATAKYGYDVHGFVTRRGRALIIFDGNDGFNPKKRAITMSKKVCDLPEVCG